MRERLFPAFKRLCMRLEGSGLTSNRTIGCLYTKLFRLLRTAGVSLETVKGRAMYLDLGDDTCMRMAMFDFEPTTSAALKKVLRPGMTFFDIGAHVGYFSLEAAELVGPGGRVYAFEPDSKNFSLLKKNAAMSRYGNVTAVNAAVSDKPGKAVMFLSKDTGRHTTKSGLRFRYKGKATVDAVSIDGFCRKTNIKSVDAMKIDIEGGEPEALKGMKNTAGRSRKMKMIIEYSPENFGRIGTTQNEFLGALLSMGFRKISLLDKKSIRKISAKRLADIRTGLYNLLLEK